MRTSQFLLLSLALFFLHSQLFLKRDLSFRDGKLGIQSLQVRCRTGDHRHSLTLLRRWLGLVGKPELLEDIGLEHEIDETREAERYNFGNGGPLVSSIRLIAPVAVGKER